MPKNYATFYKCALQLNPWTYASQYQGNAHGLSEKEYNAAIANQCLKNDIQVVGIADHGNVDRIENLRKTLEENGIVVFPGFEIASTEKVHMVCLYPAGTTAAALNQYIGSLDVPVGDKNTTPSALGCLTIADRVLKQGGFWYAAHVTGASGLLRLNKDGGGLAHIWRASDLVVAAQIPGDVSECADVAVQQILKNKDPNYQRTRPIALLNSKDVRHPDDLDNPRTSAWIKMTSPALEALRLACRDPESRVRLSNEINPTYYSRIERIVVRRGYLEDLDLDLSPNLNAVVGGRGTGKSTLIEAIRYALNLPPTNKDALRAHVGIIEANFAREKAGIEITLTSYQQNSERYVVSRYYGEPPKVLDEDGKVLKLTPKDVFPRAEIYGQNELLAILQDESAKSNLLGRFMPEDRTEKQQILDLRMALQKNRQEIDSAETRLAEIASKLEQLPALYDRDKSFKKLGLEKELGEVKLREAKRAYVAEVGTALVQLASVVDEFQEAQNAIESPYLPTEVPSPTLTEFSSLLASANDAVAKSSKDAKAAANLALKTFKASKESFDESIASDEHAFDASVNKLPTLKGKSVAQLSAEYKRVSADISKLKPLGAQKTALETRLHGLNQQRETLVEALAKIRGARWTSLGQAVKSLNKRLEGQIRVAFEPARIRSPLKEFLLECDLDGVGEKRLGWIEDAEALSVSELVALIRQGSAALLTRFKAVGMQKQVADALASLAMAKIRELEEIELPERMELLLNVNPSGETYREVGRLSTGQQCTAILHLLLLDNPDPLVLDQPEDNLDNAFIADHIVGELRGSKTKRQFLFATHNANIPVFGDAEWIGVLEEDDGRAKLRASGSIDAPDVKELAANILEGGKEAFTRRREKYGL
jgi:DNA repair ATPase RecN